MMYLFIYVLPLQPAEPARSAELPLTWAAHGENCSSSVRLSACPSRHRPQPKAEARQGKGRAERGHPEGAGGAAFTQPRVCPQGSPQGEAEPRDEAVGGSPAPLLGTCSSQHPPCRAQLLQLPRCLRHPGVGWGWEEVGVWGGKCGDTSQSLSSVSGDALVTCSGLAAASWPGTGCWGEAQSLCARGKYRQGSSTRPACHRGMRNLRCHIVPCP